MKKLFIIAAVVPMLFVSCQQDDMNESSNNTLTATATIGEGTTRTAYTDNGTTSNSALKVSWSDAESFKAYYSATQFITFSKTNGDTFNATDVPAGVTTSTTFTGVYGEKATYNSDGSVSIDFSGQDGSLENLGKYDVMTCASTTEAGALKFAFKHKCAILRIALHQYEGRDKTKMKLTFKNAGLVEGVKVSNGFYVSEDPATISCIMDIPNDVAWTTVSEKDWIEEATIYVAVPAMQYTVKGTTFVVTPDYFNKAITLSATQNIVAGKLYDVVVENKKKSSGGFGL